ncbi:phage tail tape measure protein [Aeromonas hydrophila]|uniref:phage tail tape measure protein n=1 Tax=Aeromonas hydrophila TaxID=644 RepID=UPI003D1A5300
MAIEKLMLQMALVDKVTKPLQSINAQINKVSKAGQESWTKMAMGTTTMAAGAMAIKSVVGPALEMDRALAEVASLDVHEKTLKRLSSAALRFSVDYGESATAFVRSSYDIQSAIAGLEGNELPAFARASGVLAKATKADAATITSYMGTMYGIFEKQALNMGKATWVESIAGKTALAVQMFKSSGQGMSDAFKGIGANATAAGISIDEQFTVLGHLQATMGGGEAGTKFKAFLSGVGNAQKALGLQFTDAAGNMLPVLDVLEKIKGKYGETLTVAGSDALKKAFGSDEAVSMIKLLMGNTKGLATSINALGNTHGMGKAEQMAAAMTDQWDRVKAAWFAIRAAAFATLLPAINAVIAPFADGAQHILRWIGLFPNLTKLVTGAIVAILGLGMVTGAWMLITGLASVVATGFGLTITALLSPLTLLKMGLASFRAIMLAVNIAMYANPAMLIATLIGVVLVAAIAAAIYYWDEIKATLADWGVFELLGKVIDGLGDGWASFLGWLRDLSPFQLLGGAVDWLVDKLNMLPGINIATGPAPELPDPSRLNAPLANYRQGADSRVPAGGLGQQLIQANAAATTANQKPAKAMTIGEVHNHFQNPVTPAEMEQENWMTTR